MAQTDIFNSNRTDEPAHFDLDSLFSGNLETKVYGTVLSAFSRVKLAGNPRQYTSRFSGETGTLYDYYSFGGHDETMSSRRVDHGPILPGPHMFAFVKSVMITAHAQPQEMALLIRDGDTVTFLGQDYRVSLEKRNGSAPTFTPID